MHESSGGGPARREEFWGKWISAQNGRLLVSHARFIAIEIGEQVVPLARDSGDFKSLADGPAGVDGKTPELVVRDREWPSSASVYVCCGGRTEIPGFATGFRWMCCIAPYAGAGGGCAMTVVCIFD